VIARRAAGYTPGPNGPVNAGFIHMSIPHAAGALYSTTEDLLRWEQGLFGGKLLSAASLEKMTTPFGNNYALGVIVNTSNGRKAISHGGGIEGFNTALTYYPESKLTVVVLANLNGGAPDQIASQLVRLAYGDSVVQTATTVSEAALRRLIQEVRSGNPAYDRMSQGLASVTRQQLPQLQSMLNQFGDIQTMSFKGVGPDGADLYRVDFAKGSLEFRIGLAPDGRINTALISPAN
jgi:CubicO group peptidase (beta-lactamase class C family)